MGLTAKIKASIVGNFSVANDMGTVSQAFSEAFELDIANGGGADQANSVFTDERTIAASGTDELDLAGVLTDVFGASIVGVGVKAILIVADADNTNNVEIGGAGAATFVGPFKDATDKLVLGPGDVFLVTRRSAAGMAVGAGASDKFLIANSGAGSSVTYRIVIILEV